MSNWLDVRIKLYSDKPDIETVYKKFRDLFHYVTKNDVDASVHIGSSSSKLIWCAVKAYETFNSIIGYTKVGMNENDICAIVKWITSKFPQINGISFQLRDDGSKIYHLYNWKKTTPNSLYIKKLDPEFYPQFDENVIDTYTEATAKPLQNAIKDHSIPGTMPVDSFNKLDKL